MKKGCIALALAALLLTGCAELEVVPRPSRPKTDPVPEETVRELTVYDPDGILAPALEAYSAAQGVTVKEAPLTEAAQLAVFSQRPQEDTARDLTEGSGLLRTFVTESPCYGLSLGSSSYGYVVDTTLLARLVGDSGPEVSRMTAMDWDSFVTALAAWVKEPAGQSYNAGYASYRLPRQRPEGAEKLTAVFAVNEAERFSGPVLSPVLGTCMKTPEEVTARGDRSKLIGGLNSLYTLLSQEAKSLSPRPAAQAFQEGEALFCRMSLSEAKAAAAPGQTPVVLPLPFSFDGSDLHGGFQLRELLKQPVTVGGGWLAIPSSADEEDLRAAQGFLVWLHASEEGRRLPRRENSEVPGLPDLSAALSPAAVTTLDRLGADQKDWSRQGRGPYTTAALRVLSEEGVN